MRDVTLDGFEDDWKDLNLSAADLDALKILIMAGPKLSPVIGGTGGLRKIRFAPESWNCGKSGAARICYVYFEEFWTILLVTAYRKSEMDNISAKAKAVYKKILNDTKKALEIRQKIC